MGSKLVSIKFCGGCNPRIDRARIAKEVKDALEALGLGIVYNSLNAEYIIYLSGCTAGCAQRDCNSETPCVMVAAATVDMQPVNEVELGSLIIQKVKDYLTQIE